MNLPGASSGVSDHDVRPSFDGRVKYPVFLHITLT